MNQYGCGDVKRRWYEREGACVMVSGGGTGGHITPALALCAAWRARRPGVEFWYVGRAGSLEERLARGAGERFSALVAAPWRRGLRGAWECVWVNVRGFVRAFCLVRQRRPRAIVGFGGYVSFPLLLAGISCRVPVVVHEANAVPGRTVRLLVRLGARLAYGLERGHDDFRHARVLRLHPERIRWTGNPLRTEFLEDIAGAQVALPGLREGVCTVLVVGGSQGARRLNDVVPESVGKLVAEGVQVQVIHLTGEGAEEQVKARYGAAQVPAFVAAFYGRMGVLYRWADIVVARAGALTVSEICARGVASVLVPYPHATDHHQEANASVLAEHGAAEVFRDKELSAERLTRVLQELIVDAPRRERMGAAARALAVPDAAERLIAFVEEYMEERT